ncbi:MAG: type II secretion system protein [Acidobacteriota bacterium]
MTRLAPNPLAPRELLQKFSGGRWAIGGAAGFSLIEVLVSLSLLGVAMLLTLSLLFQEPRALARLDAHREVLRAMEQVLEGIRAGQPLPTGREQIASSAIVLPEDGSARDVRMWAESTAESGSGLYRLTLTARYRVGTQWYDRSLETRVWRK